MEMAGVPGLVFSLIENHQLTSTQPVGVRNSETKGHVKKNTVFPAASLGKPVFTYGVLTLQREGKLDLDKPLNDYLALPESNEIPQLRQITARQALTHTTGLQNWRFKNEDKLEFAFEPGTGFSYSGEGFFYVQRVIEQITGQSVESFLQEQVLRPLGMVDSTYIWHPGLEARISKGHHNRGTKVVDPWNAQQGRRLLEISYQRDKPLGEWMFEDFVQAHLQKDGSLAPLPGRMLSNVAASLLTTAHDYAQFMLRLLNLKDELASQMLTPQHQLNRVLSWGLGVGLEQVNGENCFWHWGDNDTFKNFMFGNPGTGNGLVVFTNDSRGLNVCERLVREVTGHDLAAFLWI
jgi:CubicO group peptidase (beta-lactamase class C family)